ncbi:hypothetical protein MNBD_GAMMA12-2833 [hydrothermal vent metagenome]|uniref:Transcriptional regulator AbiEi antitoxin N-terminal domain-containing protein n=1 Tax=hydrothermal vent metagenome TaxID=652676 RepID=A0A3B0YCV9_9ZZZZ
MFTTITIMNRQKQTKLKDLILTWKTNTVYSSRFLTNLGYSRQLINQYEQAGWVARVGRGAYRRGGEDVDYTSGLYALQKQDRLAIHVGGLSAMEYHGKGHYLQLGKRPRVTLFGNQGTRIPKWFVTADWAIALEFYATNLFKKDHSLGLIEKDCGGYSVSCSTLERAMLEVCAIMRTQSDFEHALRLMEGLSGSTASDVEVLLSACRSVKAKRLFLYMADHHHFSWVEQLNNKKYTLGIGPRQIVKQGMYDAQFKITVPKFMLYEKMNNPDSVPF